jgi:hypothetical protein
LAIPCGKTFQWYLLYGAWWFVEGKEKANFFLSSEWSGIVKKQSSRSIIYKWFCKWMAVGCPWAASLC